MTSSIKTLNLSKNDTQRNDIRHKDTQHPAHDTQLRQNYDTQYDDIQNKDAQLKQKM